MKYIITMLIILLCSCSSRKELVKSETVNKESKIELGESESVMEYKINDIDTSFFCTQILTEMIELDTAGKPTRIIRQEKVKTKNNRISKVADKTAVQKQETTSISVKQDSATYSKEKVIEPVAKTYYFDWLWLIIVIIVCVVVKKKIDRL